MRQFDKDFNAINLKKQSRDKNELILSQDVFYTIQGEGFYAGKAAFFVRTSHCSLHCSFCDEMTWDKFRIKKTFDEILNDMQSLNKDCKLIIFTGGEPSLQLSKQFCDFFHKEGYQINIETSGSYFNPCLSSIDYVCMSPKRLSDQAFYNKQQEDRYLVSDKVLKYADEMKFIIDASTDEDMLLNFINEKKDFMSNNIKIYLSPCDELDIEKNLFNKNKIANLVMKYPNIFTISLQTHKILNLP